MNIRMQPIHPFPARMAPEIALEECKHLADNAAILDPMAGSGTVLRVAAVTGRQSFGFDLDPLAVLISSAWTSGVAPDRVVPAAIELVTRARSIPRKELTVSSLEEAETAAFADYWFAPRQKDALTRLSFCLAGEQGDLADVLRVCLSRLIIRKEKGASLARDVSHSRPHKVREDNDFDVMPEFVRCASRVASNLMCSQVSVRACVRRGDARSLPELTDSSFDAVITSPPYLNAIDYMRGHKLALIWLGHSIPELRDIRSASVGSERGAQPQHLEVPIMGEVCSLPWFSRLPRREANLVRRYVGDIYFLMHEISRLLKKAGKAVLVVGNSCLRGVYVENSRIIEIAAASAHMCCSGVYVRDLPSSLRYLPISSGSLSNDLGKRMRKECVLSFAKA